MDIAKEFLQELLKELDNKTLVLPTLPEVALRVRDAVDDEDASINDISKVIATDAALGARLIQVANSPLMRASQEIESLDMAVNRLGLKLVRDMVISMVMEQMFQATSELTDKKLREIWEHSTLVAAISHTLAAQFTKLSPQQALLAGLVHDIGALPILTRAEDYPQLLENETALDRIIEKLHSKIGYAILKAWNFPAELVKVPLEHENLQRDSEQVDYVDIVTVANLQSYMGTDHPMAKLDWSKVPAFAKLGLNPEINVVEMEETAEDIKEAQRLLSGH
ncbi:MAG: HDOD domain-containing protein [Gammaproteobacteria bacterium]|nr:HDOD domain-containing protein [Gammaproteobacteria bacterium]